MRVPLDGGVARLGATVADAVPLDGGVLRRGGNR